MSAPDRCKIRSRHHRRPMPHLFTATVTVAGRPTEQRCSWCWKQLDDAVTI